MSAFTKKIVTGFAAFALVIGTGASWASIAQADPETTDTPNSVIPVHIFTFNDFHGRVSTAIPFAYTLEKAVLEDPENSMVVSAGDNVGASEFASAISKDDPTIQLLNDIAETPGINFKASAVGNHEFDQGLADLQNRIIGGVNADGTPAPVKADWTYLGANVISIETGQPVLDPYDVYTVGSGDNTIRVGVVGVVTQETPSLVSPAGITTVNFTDPVAAVNTWADFLKDNDKADIVVAVYHEGASVATSIDDAMAASTTFTNIVTGTNSNVNAIVNGHTHMLYAWTYDGRPIVQSGSYGANVARIDLTVDPSTMAVTSATADYIPTVPADSKEIDLSLGSMQTISDHINAALSEAKVLGAQPIGTLTADVTTAYLVGGWAPGSYAGVDAITFQNPDPTKPESRDDRANESTLGRFVADTFMGSADSTTIDGADIAVVNPGGLRAELLYGTDGTISYAAANSVLPFGNNIWTIELTGQQFKQLLEEQWQTNAQGERPERSFLALGVSSNVEYTIDSDQAKETPCTVEQGCAWDDPNGHITSVFIDNQPLDPEKIYKVVTFSFLTAGGDNFRVMQQGTNARDTGLLDRDVWIDYLQKIGTVTPSFARASVVVSNLTPETAPMGSTSVAAGSPVTASLSRLDLTSLGSPANTTLQTYLAPASDPSATTLLATTTVTAPGDAEGCAAAGVPADLNPDSNGCAKMNVTIPADTAAGDYILTSVALPSNTTVTMSLTVTPGPAGSGNGGNGTTIGTGGYVPAGSMLPAVIIVLLISGSVAVIAGRRLVTMK